MYYGKEDSVVTARLAVGIRAIAENEAKSIGCLMPGAASLHLVRFFCICELFDAGLLEWVGQICCCEAIAEKFGEGTASRSTAWVWEIVMDVRFTTCLKKK